jgi:pimeloyl-ACP methyl ester carboxylesterase
MEVPPRMSDPFGAEYAVPVTGGTLHVAGAGADPRGARAVVVALHGVASAHVAWRAVARQLHGQEGIAVLAPDLRGRGRSAQLPVHDAFSGHTEDIVAVLDALNIDKALLAGHSMGAYIAAGLAADHPERVSRLVLIDGGLPLPLEDGADPEEVLEQVLGPALARLRMTFDSPEGYVAFWRSHPAFKDWSEDIEAFARYDFDGDRSAVSETAVRNDFAALLLDEPTRTAAARSRAPTRLLRAPRGLMDDDNVMIPDAALEALVAQRPDVRAELVEGVNHYTIVMGAGAPRVAATIAAAVA